MTSNRMGKSSVFGEQKIDCLVIGVVDVGIYVMDFRMPEVGGVKRLFT